MFKGYAAYGAVEVANVVRLAEYVANGIGPRGVTVDDCSDCSALPDALGHDAYDSPIIDGAPWMDAGNPDSADFAGVMILDMSGVDDSPTTATVTDRVGNGGIISGRRAGPKSMTVSAIAVARTAAGLQAGLSWLTASLHPPCAGDDCGGDTLHLFSSCPPVCSGLTDPDALPVSVLYDTPLLTETTTGTGAVVWVGPVLPGVCDTITMEWEVEGASPATVVPGMADFTGNILLEGDDATAGTDPTTVTLEAPGTVGFPDNWRPVLVVPGGQDLTVTGVTVTHRPILTTEQCVSPYRRTFRNVVTVQGPTVVEEYAAGDDGEAVMAKVEWVWVATLPWSYADPTALLSAVDGRGTTEGYVAPGVQIADAAAKSAAATECVLPAPSILSCADNTCCTPLLLPPSAPVLLDDCLMVPDGYQRREFQISPSVTPAGLGVLTWTFVNDESPKMGVRVRVWEDPDPDFGIPPERECQWVQEFTIDYLAANQSLVIDGAGETITALCGIDAYNIPVVVDATRNVSGAYGGPFSYAPIGCGRRYHVAVDVPNTYTTSCPEGYTSGESQGDLAWSVALTRRT